MKSGLFDSTILGTAQQAVEFVSNILESSTEYSVIGKDLEGKILLWNEGACRMYGYEAEEVVGKTSDLLHTAEDVANLFSDLLCEVVGGSSSTSAAADRFSPSTTPLVTQLRSECFRPTIADMTIAYPISRTVFCEESYIDRQPL